MHFLRRHLRLLLCIIGLALPLLTALSVQAQVSTSAPVVDPADRRGVPTDVSPHVALILPTKSAALGKLAEGFAAGFVAAADVDRKLAPPYVIYPVDAEGPQLLAVAKEAMARGAVMVVGGLTRDGATTLAGNANWGIPVLALNQPAESLRLPDDFFFVSLSAEQEARLAAHQAFVDGVRTAVVVATRTTLSQRVAEAFEREWQRVGGGIAKRLSFGGGPHDAANLKGKVADGEADFIFFAVDANEARNARPYLPQIPIAYGTSLISDLRADGLSNLDLSGTRFMEMPWFVQADHPAVAIYGRPKVALPFELEKLYALGIDAYRITTSLLKPVARRSYSFDGVTGKLELEARHSFTRQPVPVEYVEGKLVLRSRE